MRNICSQKPGLDQTNPPLALSGSLVNTTTAVCVDSELRTWQYIGLLKKSRSHTHTNCTLVYILKSTWNQCCSM